MTLSPDQSVVLLGVSFCLVYLAFNGAQNLLTSGSEKLGPFELGSWSLGGLYLANTVSGLCLAVPACSWTTDRNAIIYWIGAVPVFIIANVVYQKYTLLPASVFAGLSAGVQWTACWGYLSSCISWKNDPKQTAFLTGVFYGIMQSSQILGNLSSSIFQHHVSDGDVWLAVFYAVSCAVGMALLFFLPNLKREHPPIIIPIGEKLTGMANIILKEPPMRWMVLMFIYSGYTQTYFFGIFTNWVSDALTGSTSGSSSANTEDIGYVMAWFGFSDSIFSFLLGWLGSQMGGKYVISASSLSCAAAIALLCGLDGHHHMVSLSGIAFLFGAADAGYNAIIVATLTRFYPKSGGPEQVYKSTCAFAAFQMFQAGVTSIAFFYNSSISNWTQTYIFATTLVLAVFAYFWLAAFHFTHIELPTVEQDGEDADSETKGLLQDDA
eukprot:TRINITY_DN12800_c0_g1_i2.p1 TRINITY_DN12800_c0_g1~~TRINITY_DN12800_c0_g1_i2.p1  ORF type:complete len:454 (+),score=66.51 TRINITY_DN12800_c0_g1_i2:53-1363(+)